jgi:hypothetical protein
MSCASFFIFFLFASVFACADASRDNEHNGSHAPDGEISLSFGHRNFEQMHGEKEPRSGFSLANITEASSAGEDAVSMEGAVAKTIHAATEDLAVVRDNARELRKSVESLQLDFGVDEKNEMARLQAAALSKQRAQAKSKLREVADERQRLMSYADKLDSQLRGMYKSLVGTEYVDTDLQEQQAKHNLDEQQKLVEEQRRLETVAQKFGDSEVSLAEAEKEYQAITAMGRRASMAQLQERSSPDKSTEDAQFDKLEQETYNILSWFDKLKTLKHQRDSLKAKREEATQAAKKLGLSQEEIAKQLAHVDDSSNAEPVRASSLVQFSTHQELTKMMATSALDMQRIEDTADDVMRSIAAFGEWKQRSDDSPTSIRQGIALKDKLQADISFLQQSEHLINDRANQVNKFLRTIHPSGQ